MIEVTVPPNYFGCGACGEKVDVRMISMGITEHHTRSIVICKSCLAEINKGVNRDG